jgi:hypothetical protein
MTKGFQEVQNGEEEFRRVLTEQASACLWVTAMTSLFDLRMCIVMLDNSYSKASNGREVILCWERPDSGQ